jgi:hypothetical protein
MSLLAAGQFTQLLSFKIDNSDGNKFSGVPAGLLPGILPD